MYHHAAIREGLADFQSQQSKFATREGKPILITVGTLAGIFGCTRFDLVHLNEKTRGPFGKNSAGVPVAAALEWAERTAPHFDGGYGGAEVEQVIAAVNKAAPTNASATVAAMPVASTPPATSVAPAPATSVAVPIPQAPTVAAPTPAPDLPEATTEEGRLALDCVRCWKSDAALRAEFNDNIAAYFAYREGVAAGRIKDRSPAEQFRQQAGTAPAPDPDAVEAEAAQRDALVWHGSAQLRAEFGGNRAAFDAYQKAARAGRIKGRNAI